MNLFVDSNVYLNFYHFSNDDLEELKKLSELIKRKEITLYVTQQVIDEVKRNRDAKVADAYKKFKDTKLHFRLPQICKTYSEYETIKKSLAILNKAKSELIGKLYKDIEQKTLKADEIIDELFELAEIIDSAPYLDAARNRYQLGNPPGKKGSYGDAVNWEALLGQVADKEDLFFISDDRDFRSPIGNGAFNSFLLDEWEKNKKSKLSYYMQLSEFFIDHHKEIKLRVEEEKNQLISALSRSGNFEDTHTLIAKLSKFDGFSDSQTRQMVEAALENSQIYWIAQDSDVNSFFGSLVQGNDALFDADEIARFWELFDQEDEGETPHDNSDDHLPDWIREL